MESPSSSLRRVLAGLCVALLFLTALAIEDGSLVITAEDRSSEEDVSVIFPILAGVFGLLYISISKSSGKALGQHFLDRWISREMEEDMVSRLQLEQEEAGAEGMGTAWAELEKSHLEDSLGEEE